MTSTAVGSGAPAYSSYGELEDAIERAASSAPDALFSVAELPVRAGNAEALLELEPQGHAHYFAEPSGAEHVGVGAVQVLSGSGEGRFAELTQALSDFFANLSDSTGGLRLFGGFAFQPARAASSVWQPFGEARFVVPRFAYEQRGDAGVLRVLLKQAEFSDRAARRRVSTEGRAFLSALTEPQPSARPLSGELPAETADDGEYLHQVELVQRAIAEGALEKLVLARSAQLTLPRRIAPAQVLARLASVAPECTRFAFASGGSTFVGATPERLVEKSGHKFRTEAVAGSIPAGELPAGRLMESSKDRAEQAIVVREVVRALEPIAARIEYDETPEIHRLRHVAHLRTKIVGELREPHHVLSLVERLHPTPAVGGVPKARALAWIAEHERTERGWYAGPIGWADARGDGAFVVALRSGVLCAETAVLYSGAGIVQGSDPERELSETRWKQQALRAALGAVP